MSGFTIDLLWNEKHIQLKGVNCIVYCCEEKKEIYRGSIEGLGEKHADILVMLIEDDYIRPI
jgi:hypothetical protein